MNTIVQEDIIDSIRALKHSIFHGLWKKDGNDQHVRKLNRAVECTKFFTAALAFDIFLTILVIMAQKIPRKSLSGEFPS